MVVTRWRRGIHTAIILVLVRKDFLIYAPELKQHQCLLLTFVVMVEPARLLVVIHALAVLDVVESAALEVVSILMRQMGNVIPGALSGVASTTDKVEADLCNWY